MATPIHSLAAQKRADALNTAHAMRIDGSLIGRMVEVFYGKVRDNETLGDIFKSEIGGTWDTHLAKMKAFWGAIVFSDGRYSGKPVPAHQKLTDVKPDDFDIWLTLFDETLDDIAATPEAKVFLKTRAANIAKSLKLAMFDRAPSGTNQSRSAA